MISAVTEPPHDSLTAVWILAKPEAFTRAIKSVGADEGVSPGRAISPRSTPPPTPIQLELVQVLRLLEPLGLGPRDFIFKPVRPLRRCDRPLRLKVTRDRLILTGRIDRQEAIFRQPTVRTRVLARLRTIGCFRRISSARATFQVARNFMAVVSETDTSGGHDGHSYRNCGLPIGGQHHPSP